MVGGAYNLEEHGDCPRLSTGMKEEPMIRRRIETVVALALLLTGCASIPDRNVASLRCEYPWEGGGFIGFYSFGANTVTPPVVDPARVDLVYYFDEDDCFEGAILGNDDRSGYLFPIGHKRWSELARLEPPSAEGASVGAIIPVTKAEEGLALWVKSGSGSFYLVQITEVQPATCADLVAGLRPTVKFEWSGPRGSD